MKAARIENGVVADLWEVPSLTCYEGVTLFEAPENVEMGWLFDGTVFSKPPLTLEEIEYAKTDYQRKRAAEYPDFKNYLDGVVKGDAAQIQAYITECLAVKTKYPK